MDRELIAEFNRQEMPNVYALLDDVLPDLRQHFPEVKVRHAVDHDTQMEVGSVGDRIKPKEMIARRCDEHMEWSDEHP